MKRKLKKLTSLLLAAAMMLAMCLTALADDGVSYTITVSNPTIGNTYTAYKIFDATYSGDAVSYSITSDNPWYQTISAAETSGGEKIFILTETSVTGEEGFEVCTYTVTVSESASDEDVIAFFTKCDIPQAAVASANEIAQNAGGLTLEVREAGYYYITTNTGSTVTITNVTPTATVIDKNTPPGNLTKVIHETAADEGEEDQDLHSESEAVGDDVEFVITADVPLYAPYDESVSDDSATRDGYLVYDYEFDDHMDAGLDIEGLTTVENADADSDCDYYVVDNVDGTQSYYATNSLINKWVKLTQGDETYYLVSGTVDGTEVPGVAYNVVLELILSEETYPDEEIHFSRFKLTYDTVDISGTDWEEIHYASEVETKYPTNAVITIDYKAHVTNEAVYDNENDIDMVWHMVTFRNPEEPNPDEPKYTGENKDYADVLIWELDILKIDSDGTTGPLAGAEFELSGTNLHDVVVSTEEYYSPIETYNEYRTALNDGEVLYFKLVDGSYTTVSPYGITDSEQLEKYVETENAPENYKYTAYTHTVDITTEVTPAEDETVTGTTGENGELSFKGLKQGTYTLTEIQAPDGYNLMPCNITIVITYDQENSSFTVTVTDDDEENVGNINSKDGVISITIENNTGSELPSTGGMGTTIFYIAGILLMIFAAAAFVAKRRIDRKN